MARLKKIIGADNKFCPPRIVKVDRLVRGERPRRSGAEGGAVAAEYTYYLAVKIVIEIATGARQVASEMPDDCCAEAVAGALEELVEALSGR